MKRASIHAAFSASIPARSVRRTIAVATSTVSTPGTARDSKNRSRAPTSSGGR